MAKSFTDIEQSKKLAEFLPIESADMCYRAYKEEGGILDYGVTLCPYQFASWTGVPCWSLAALLDILDKTAYLINENASVNLFSYKTIKWTICIDNCGVILITEANPIDACIKMILKLHELNLL